MTPTRHATVATIVVADGTGGLDDTVSAVGSQVYEASSGLVVAGRVSDSAEGDVPSLADALDGIDPAAEWVWILRAGACPKPDALGALVRDADRTDAGIAGSKIVTTDEALVSVGLVTDVFGVPYTGLDPSERDQGQYDVVRDVAAVAGVSLLIRRDLLRGLGGIDAEMAPLAAAVDLAQRARLKGARVIISPASEVRFDDPEFGPDAWREQASRTRSYLKVYGPLTVAWVLPLDVIISMIQAVVSLFFGRWLVWDAIRAWGWNVVRLPSTLGLRRVARRGRVVGDAEIFRFQRRGSVVLSHLATRSMVGIRRRLPGDDTLSVESIGRDVRQPAFVVGILAVGFVLLSARQLWSDGLPAVGYTMPFPASGWDALAGYAGGWNPAGLGSAELLRPLVALAGLAKLVTFNAAHVSEYIVGAGALLLGVWGVTRLLRTWSIRAAPGLIAGIVYVAGPTAQGIGGNTHIGYLVGLGILPWALRLCLAPLRGGLRPAAGRIAGVIVVFGLLGAVAPLLILVPVPVLVVYAAVRFSDPSAWRSVVLALAGTAGGGLLLSPWIWGISFEAIAREGYAFWTVPSVLAIAGALVAVAAVLGAERRLGLVAAWGSLMAGSGFLLSRSGSFGLGTETESAALAVTGLGLAVVVGVVADTVAGEGVVRWRRFIVGLGAVGVVLLVVSASVIVLGGRIGLPGDRYGDVLSFTMANEGEAERSRVLLVGPPGLMPGDSRTLEGGSYRVVSAPVPDLGEPRLSAPGPLDAALADTLGVIVAGDTRRAGGELASFGIRWIVILGDSEGADADPESLAWRQVFAGQLDLLPLSAGVEEAVFVTDIDPVGRALTSTAESWERVGWSYVGEPEPGKRVFVAENPDPGFGPGVWRDTASANEVSADSGRVEYEADGGARAQAIGAFLAVVALVAVTIWGRRAS